VFWTPESLTAALASNPHGPQLLATLDPTTTRASTAPGAVMSSSAF
jgi:hypothetical protein